MKITGTELRTWMAEAWPHPDCYWDHDLFEESPEVGVDYDTSEIGDLRWQGKASEKPFEGDRLPLDDLIRKWRQDRIFTPVLILVPKAGAEPAALPERDAAAISAAAQYLLADEIAMEVISRALVKHCTLPPAKAARAALEALAGHDADLRLQKEKSATQYTELEP